jgi:hypothetical protein
MTCDDKIWHMDEEAVSTTLDDKKTGTGTMHTIRTKTRKYYVMNLSWV